MSLFFSKQLRAFRSVFRSYRHARLYLTLDQVKEFAQGAEELLEWIEMGGEDPFTLLKEQEDLALRQEEARRLLEEGELSEAIDRLEAMVEDHPNFWPAHNNLALAYFYKGANGKAYRVTEHVLSKNKGNLHALCNLAVFYYFDQQTEKLNEILTTLGKIRPFILEHRYKLGATFAITKNYKKAYAWLRSLQKLGYIGDASFYYWLAKSAFFTGNDMFAADAWKQLVKIEPEKALGDSMIDEWSQDRKQHEVDCTIIKNLRSDHIEERLFAIFLLANSKQKHELMTKIDLRLIDELTLLEKLYVATVFKVEKVDHEELESFVRNGHQTALTLSKRYELDEPLTQQLLMTWFKTFQAMTKWSERIINPTAFAAATEYLFFLGKDERKTQQEIANEYNLSPATVRKYMKNVESIMKMTYVWTLSEYFNTMTVGKLF